MLFKTVYGPELECIYEYLKLNGPQDREMLYKAFVPLVKGEMGPRSNLDDALVFLTSGRMIIKNEVGVFGAAGGVLSFRLQLLQNLRHLQLGGLEPSHPMDPWYLGLVDRLFVRPCRPVAFALHQLANTLEVPEILSEERVRAATRVAGPGLHVFGISGIEVAAELMAMDVRSIDSSRPMKAAMYHLLFYGRPFRRYKLKNSKIKEKIATIESPLPCECPICKKDPALIFRAGEKKYHNMRAVHNYYHLRTELEGILKT